MALKTVIRSDGSEMQIHSDQGHPTFGKNYDGPWHPEYHESAQLCIQCIGSGVVRGVLVGSSPQSPAPTIGPIPCPACKGAGRSGRALPPPRPPQQFVVMEAPTVHMIDPILKQPEVPPDPNAAERIVPDPLPPRRRVLTDAEIEAEVERRLAARAAGQDVPQS